MFNEIAIKMDHDRFFDLGKFAESLLFYRHINVVCRPPLFKLLFENGQLNAFMELIDTERITLHLHDKYFGISNFQDSPDWKSFGVIGPTVNDNALSRIEYILGETTQKKNDTQRVLKVLERHSKEINIENSITDDILLDIKNVDYLKEAISTTVKCLHPNNQTSPLNFELNIESRDNQFKINTGLNLVDSSGKKLNFEMNDALFSVVNTRYNINVASQLNCDMALDEVCSSLIIHSFNDLSSHSNDSHKQISNFNEHILNGRNIRSSINNGHKTLTDFLLVLDKSDMFREWTLGQNKDANLISEYINAISKESWFEGVPVKSFKWLFFQGLGTVIDMNGGNGVGSALSNMTLSAMDTFLLDNLSKGWKPNSFVNLELKPFVQ